MKTTHSATHHNGKTYHFNLAYQVERHMEYHVQQWPHIDPAKARRDIRSRMLRGQCWYHPEPRQLDLFGEAA